MNLISFWNRLSIRVALCSLFLATSIIYFRLVLLLLFVPSTTQRHSCSNSWFWWFVLILASELVLEPTNLKCIVLLLTMHVNVAFCCCIVIFFLQKTCQHILQYSSLLSPSRGCVHSRFNLWWMVDKSLCQVKSTRYLLSTVLHVIDQLNPPHVANSVGSLLNLINWLFLYYSDYWKHWGSAPFSCWWSEALWYGELYSPVSNSMHMCV